MWKRVLLLCTILFSLQSIAQKKANITGIWQGYFYNDVGSARYKFEVQINNLTTNGLKGVTYSYRTTVFYGKAALQGVFMPKANNIVLKETKMLEMRITDNSQPCLMTCYLTYSKSGNKEILEGTYTSENRESGECGGGIVHLEKTTTTDFVKEDFIIAAEKKAGIKKSNNTAAPKTIPAKKPSVIAATPKKPTPNPTVNNTKPLAKPSNPAPKPKTAAKPVTPVPKATVNTNETNVNVPTAKTGTAENKNNLPESVLPKPVVVSVPPILQERSNSVVKSYTTEAKTIKVTLYDNGEIDGDVVSVYHNNQLVLSNQQLTTKPIEYIIKSEPGINKHTITLVAENEGKTPPNTALVVIETDGKRYELIASTDKGKNASIEFTFKQ
ncbi:MAG: hypothetical protein EAY68_01190 [Bacteroidetes bacterium]|nr:MAG: hypothetical protein EAY68_01190 [Bacteroidota bacterium]